MVIHNPPGFKVKSSAAERRKKRLRREKFMRGLKIAASLSSLVPVIYLGMGLYKSINENLLKKINYYNNPGIEQGYQYSSTENEIMKDFEFTEPSTINTLIEESRPQVNNNQTLEDKIENSEVSPDAVSYKEEYNLIKKIEQTTFDDEVLELYADLIQKFPLLYSAAYKVAKENDIDPALLMGLATLEGGIQMKYYAGITENGTELRIENSLNKDIRGVCQIGKSTWQTYGKDYTWDDMYEYESNMIVASRVLKAYLAIFENDLTDALTAYNLGPEKAKNVKTKYANNEKGKIVKVLNRWVSQGFKEYTEPANYPRRVLEGAYYFQKVLEKVGAYDNKTTKMELTEEFIKTIPRSYKSDSLLLHNTYKKE
ncbi:MAG: Transglycosylase domain [Candidatus Woesearchaeota archaeon]|nr:Transglycosylase domain [Candidatus Woesearchaeota archaeon]MDN5327512.1 Transglycosylase domain [Candidatus Woesearchaeota archaeon]